MSYDSSNLTTPDIKWLGVRPSDLDRFDIPQQCRLPMTDEDVKTGHKLVCSCLVRSMCSQQALQAYLHLRLASVLIKFADLSCCDNCHQCQLPLTDEDVKASHKLMCPALRGAGNACLLRCVLSCSCLRGWRRTSSKPALGGGVRDHDVLMPCYLPSPARLVLAWTRELCACADGGGLHKFPAVGGRA